MGDTDRRADSLRALAAQLEQRDEVVASQIAVVSGLATRVSAVRARAGAIGERLDALPGELDTVVRAQGEGRTAAEEARGELAEAEQRLQQVESSRRSSAEDHARAQRALQDAREALADAERRVDRLTARHVELRDLEQALQAEAEGLAIEARGIAAGLREAARVADVGASLPGTSLEEIDDWGARARAALFVARGTLETERERIVVEANALGAAVLGEELAGTSVALVRRRVEDALS